MLSTAKRGVYSEERLSPVPDDVKGRYFLRSRDRSRGLVRIVPELRSRISFHRLNFMEGDFGISDLMDVIFCRNVLIYFERETQERLIGRLCNQLPEGGFLFVGHSETLHGMRVPLAQVGPMIYRKES